MMRALRWPIQHNFYGNGQLRLIFFTVYQGPGLGWLRDRNSQSNDYSTMIEDSGISGQGAWEM